MNSSSAGFKFSFKKTTSHRPESSVAINLENTKYSAIGRTALRLRWTLSEDDDWDILWCDSGTDIDQILRKIKPFQKVNHFSKMNEIYRKHTLSRTLSRMVSMCDLYNFAPTTWELPRDFKTVQAYLRKQDGANCVIVKPSAGSQGKGIYLTFSEHELQPSFPAIVQTYITRPLLIDGFKFDLRIYVLITCCDPLRILIYRDGLVRLCTAPYEMPQPGNIECSYMHLTNYSVNKRNSNFIQNNDPVQGSEDGSSKRSLLWLWSWLRSSRNVNPEPIWKGICDIVVKTLIATQGSLAEAYKKCKVDAENITPFTCFEVLGFDIILCEDLRPILLEVNHAPSFRTDSAIDERVKSGLIENVMLLLNASGSERVRHLRRAADLAQVRLYGTTFGAGDESKRQPRRRETPEALWRQYLDCERKFIGNFELLLPTDEYDNQPTAGKQEMYIELLQKAELAYFKTKMDRERALADVAIAAVAGLPPVAPRLKSRKSTSSNTKDGRESRGRDAIAALSLASDSRDSSDSEPKVAYRISTLSVETIGVDVGAPIPPEQRTPDRPSPLGSMRRKLLAQSSSSHYDRFLLSVPGYKMPS